LARTGRRTNLEIYRDEIVEQLRESLVFSRESMINEQLTLTERQRWTQIHTNTAQVLNTILRDLQFKEWEKRLKQIENSGLIDNLKMASVTP
jgi:aspartate/tyrosine/aromatic aminotransferase